MIQSMGQRHRKTRGIATALAVLLTASFAGASSLVLCLGADGHRALELAHPGTECHAPVTADKTDAVSSSTSPSHIVTRPSSECLDLPAAGTTPVMLSRIDGEQIPAPLTAPFLPAPELLTEGETRLPAPTAARAVSSQRARQLRSTVLLV